MLFDTHAHMDDKQFDTDRDTLLAQLPAEGISLLVNIGANLATSKASCALAQHYAYVYAAVGVHPEDVATLTEEDLAALRTLAQGEKVVAIGEIGLDYHYGDVPKAVQREWFVRQLALAQELDLPVVIHDREAHADCMAIVKEVGYHNGVFHCFSGSAEMARQLAALGWYVAFGGTVTFQNAPKVKEAAMAVPTDRLLLETDCPYLCPHPFRGKRNNPAMVRYVAEEIARLRGWSFEETARITMENGKRLFRIQ